jgi:hypothetical protein
MPANYVLLGKITLTQTTSFITFSNIPQSGYTDLKLVASVRALRTGYPADDLIIQFNGVTSGYSGRRLFGLSTTLTSDTHTDIRGYASDADQTADVFGSNEFHIPNYLSSASKSVLIDMVTETNGLEAPLGIFAGLWANSAAINSIKVFANNSNMVAKSTFYLYGLAAVGTTPAISPFATGGDVVTSDGTYWYHAFLSSGTFTPAKELTCDYLVVAGGGGAGASFAGGGGAGGLRSTVTATGGGGAIESALSVTTDPYAILIGAGGAASTSGSLDGANGSNSVFATITSLGGGGGGSDTNPADQGADGGSGGGSAIDAAIGGAGTVGQGFAGGGGNRGILSGGGGGGGGQAGFDATSGTTPSKGGNGVQITALATPTSTGYDSGYYAGGGGASQNSTAPAGGLGGGGTGGRESVSAPTAGKVNSGGGGGALKTDVGTSQPGGSGIVIIRYPIA